MRTVCIGSYQSVFVIYAALSAHISRYIRFEECDRRLSAQQHIVMMQLCYSPVLLKKFFCIFKSRIHRRAATRVLKQYSVDMAHFSALVFTVNLQRW